MSSMASYYRSFSLMMELTFRQLWTGVLHHLELCIVRLELRSPPSLCTLTSNPDALDRGHTAFFHP